MPPKNGKDKKAKGRGQREESPINDRRSRDVVQRVSDSKIVISDVENAFDGDERKIAQPAVQTTQIIVPSAVVAVVSGNALLPVWVLHSTDANSKTKVRYPSIYIF